MEGFLGLRMSDVGPRTELGTSAQKSRDPILDTQYLPHTHVAHIYIIVEVSF